MAFHIYRGERDLEEMMSSELRSAEQNIVELYQAVLQPTDRIKSSK